MNQIISDEDILRNVSLRIASAPPTPEQRRTRTTSSEWKVIGFGPKSKVTTSFGNLPIEALRRNDPLKTRTGAFLRVRWVDTLKLDPGFLSSNPQAQPVFIPAGAIGNAKPQADMLISPAQTLEASGGHGGDAFVAAATLVGSRGISRKPQSCFTYYLFGCDEPCSVCVDGIWCRIYPENALVSAATRAG